MQASQDEYLKLCEEIWRHNKLYFEEQQPEISDEAFDRLMDRLKKIEKEHPDWTLPNSPNQKVGEALTRGFKTVEHQSPMLSLANTYSMEEVEDFIKRVKKGSHHPNPQFCCELKMDGIAVSLLYKKGTLIRGLTRGDGKKGDDITQNLKMIVSLPQHLSGNNLPDLLEVRGEVFMPHEAFKMMNEQRKDKEEALWANPRNAAAGSLKLLDPQEAAQRKLDIVFYGIAPESTVSIPTQHEVHAYLKQHGLPILHQIGLCSSIEEIMAFTENIRQERAKLSFDIDGVVIKLNDLQEQRHLGSTGKNPRWAVAYKFAAEQARTIIKEITVQIGRTGVLTPVAELEPVFLAGSTISRATLHNADEVARKDIRVGDSVIIEKGGDVIPKVVSVNLDLRPKDTHPWQMPLHCPNCGSEVIKAKGEVAFRCPNLHCSEQQLRSLIYFTNRDAMDIEHLGAKVMEQLFRKGFVKTPADIYTLTTLQLYQMEGFKDKSVQNLLESIEKSKKVTLDRFIMALGIKYVGTETAEMLAAKAGSIEKLMQMNQLQLMQIDGVGEKVAASIEDYFNDSHHRQEIQRLLDAGIKFQKAQQSHFSGHVFEGKVIVLTGTLEKYPRNEAADLIKSRGGKVSETVSKKTDYVIAGDSPGSKLEKARNFGVQILDEKAFEALL